MLLRTPRLLLREFTAHDAPVLRAYQADPRYLRFSEVEDWGEGESRALLRCFLEWQREQPRGNFQLAIELSASGELIGNVGLRRDSSWDRTAELGFELSPAHWGHGYATEAAHTLLDYGFRDLLLHRVEARCVAENLGSVGVLERVGLRREGTLREAEFFRGRWWDVHLYGILVSDWAFA